MATLGPSGTDSENAAEEFLKNKSINGEIKLFDTFFESLNSVVEGKNDFAIVPSAFPQFADCVFDFPELMIIDSFVLPLKDLVIAKRKDKEKIRTIAIHPATKDLVKAIGNEVEIIEVTSKPLAAKMAALGKVDACIASLDVVRNLGLKVVHKFECVNMSWAVFGSRK